MLAETKANSEMNDSNSEETLTKIKVKKKKKVKNADTTNGVLEQTNLLEAVILIGTHRML